MDSVRDTVSYCCIWKDDRALYTYSVGNPEIDHFASLCLERTPSYHLWYFETIGKNTFGFLMDEGFVYFAIVSESYGNSEVLRFLQKLRDEFKKLGKNYSKINFTSLDALCLQEKLRPIVDRLVASLELVSGTETAWPAENPSPCNNANGHIEGGASTKAPLLVKPSKLGKKKMKDHAIVIRDIEMEEHRRSSDRSVRNDSRASDSDNQGTSASQKDFSSSRSKSNLQKKWCRQVRIVIAFDAAVCVILLVIWLVICRGIQCIR